MPARDFTKQERTLFYANVAIIACSVLLSSFFSKVLAPLPSHPVEDGAKLCGRNGADHVWVSAGVLPVAFLGMPCGLVSWACSSCSWARSSAEDGAFLYRFDSLFTPSI